MALACNNCGNSKAYRVSVRMIDGKPADLCDRCGVPQSSSWIPDVYWPGHAYTSDNIVDERGEPILLTSRRHKAEVMRQQNLSEAGDRYHGSRADFLAQMANRPQQDSRPQVRQAIQSAIQQLRRKYRP